MALGKVGTALNKAWRGLRRGIGGIWDLVVSVPRRLFKAPRQIGTRIVGEGRFAPPIVGLAVMFFAYNLGKRMM